MDEELNPAVDTSQTATGADEQQPSVEQTPGQQPAATDGDGPSKEDLTRGIAKWRNTARELQDEVAKLRSQPASPAFSPSQAPVLDSEAERGLQVIEDRMRAVVAPIQEKLDASEREQVTGKFWSDPTAQVIAPEIQNEFSKLSPSMPYAQRLETAKGLAIANNLPAFQKAYEQIGIEKAYAGQTLKNGQKSDNTTGARVPGSIEPKSLLEKVQSGEIRPGSPEYMRNRSEILRQEQAQFLG